MARAIRETPDRLFLLPNHGSSPRQSTNRNLGPVANELASARVEASRHRQPGFHSAAIRQPPPPSFRVNTQPASDPNPTTLTADLATRSLNRMRRHRSVPSPHRRTDNDSLPPAPSSLKLPSYPYSTFPAPNVAARHYKGLHSDDQGLLETLAKRENRPQS